MHTQKLTYGTVTLRKCFSNFVGKKDYFFDAKVTFNLNRFLLANVSNLNQNLHLHVKFLNTIIGFHSQKFAEQIYFIKIFMLY